MRTSLIPHILIAAVAAVSFSLPASAASKTIATVNGKKITEKTYERYLKNRKQAQAQKGVNRQALIQELVNRELLKQTATKKKLHKNRDIAFQIDQLRTDALIQALIAKNAKANPITDKKLKKEYDEKVASANIKEYKARHVLLKTEVEAKTVIGELDGGAVFADVAKAKSTGPTAKNGGDLGWFKASQMVPPFAQALAEMKKDSYSKKPVQTRFGWHVIKLEDSRDVTPPKFEDIKEQIRAVMQNKQLQEYVLSLRKKAKIDIKK